MDKLEALLDDGAGRWLLLEETGATLKALYELSTTPEYEWLFLETPYSGFLKYSPLVIRVDSLRSELFQIFREDPVGGRFPGILVTSHAAEAEVLDHLRRCLAVRFYGERLGMVRFYHPAVAAVLFSPEAQPGAEWLGPLERWVWFGGTLAQQADVGLGWYGFGTGDVQETSVSPSDSSSPIPLSSSQERALEVYMRQQRDWRIYRRPGDRLEEAESCRHFWAAFQLAETQGIPADQRRKFFADSRKWPAEDLLARIEDVSLKQRWETWREPIVDHGKRSAR
ncbi:DUF4123 domain-containing protein [Onishia niordana]|uniref:DUF4123 domain-containing protein n=1 Tax=Onishia niordana TaxID=2508711 RepID=UPI00144613D6|nr:DUF4123 domain-containing protein [Halomonas niordiana]